MRSSDGLLIDEPESKEALDVFGRILMEVRDSAIHGWDMTISGGRYPPWDRILKSTPQLSEESKELVRRVLPHIVDSVLADFLQALDAHADRVDVVVELGDGRVVGELWRRSWGLANEPCGENGWMARFSKERYEDPLDWT